MTFYSQRALTAAMTARVSTDTLARPDADGLMDPALSADSHFNGAVCLNGAMRELAKPGVLFLWLQFKEQHQRSLVLKAK